MWLHNSLIILLPCFLATVIAETGQAKTEENNLDLEKEEGFERVRSSEEEQVNDDEELSENIEGNSFEDEGESLIENDSEEGNKEFKRGRGGKVNVEDCLRAHNDKRALHQDTPALVWDAKLARRANKWAKRLAKTGTLQHDPNLRSEGENLYMAYGSTTTTCKDAVESWYSEIKDYDYNKPGFSRATGHFTQVVWKKTTRVGVALKKKKKDKNTVETYIVARYSPPGNYLGQFQQNVGRTTS